MMDKSLRTLTQKVWWCLENYPETRSSDRSLILHVYQVFYGVFTTPFYKVMDDGDLPSFESIRRCRQKIQEENEDLRAEKPVEDVRIAKQEEYITYAKGEITL
jgi:hypothetical protein